MSAHAIWTGALSFGLVTIPCKAYKATDEPNAETSLNELHNCGNGKYAPANRKQHCLACAKDILASDIVKGIKQADGSYVIISKDELATIKPSSSDTIVVESYVKINTIDSLYVRDTWYLTASTGAAKEAYATMAAAMLAEGTAAQGRWTVYGRSHNVIIRPFGSVFAIQQMRSVNEVREAEELPGFQAAKSITINPASLKMARMMVTNSLAEFDATEYEDEYVADFKALVAAKVSGKVIAGAPAAKVVMPTADLMAALTASLAGVKTVVKKTAKPSVGSGPKSSKGVKAAPKGKAKGKGVAAMAMTTSSEPVDILTSEGL